MVLAAGALIVLALIFGPSLWVKLVMRRYSTVNPLRQACPRTPVEQTHLNSQYLNNYNIKNLDQHPALMFYNWRELQSYSAMA